MISPAYGFNEEVGAFVSERIGGSGRGFSNSVSIGFVDGGNLVAGIVYHNWEPDTKVIEISAASSRRNWASKSNLRLIFEYPFDQLQCRMCVARIAENNARARRIWRAFGADEYRIPGLRGPAEAEIIYTLTAETWRAGKFGKA